MRVCSEINISYFIMFAYDTTDGYIPEVAESLLINSTSFALQIAAREKFEKKVSKT